MDTISTNLGPNDAGIPTISITHPTQAYAIEESTADPDASPVLQPSQGSYSLVDSDFSDDCEWTGDESSEADSSDEDYEATENQIVDHWGNGSDHDRRTEIEEALEDLVSRVQSLSGPPSASTVDINHVATAPFRGRGVPDLDRGMALHNRQEPNSITRTGQQPYHGTLRIKSASASSESRLFTRRRKSLQDQLFEALQRRDDITPITKGFFPSTALSAMITFETVRKELRKDLRDDYSLDDILDFARMVCNQAPLQRRSGVTHYGMAPRSYRKIFVILVMIDRTAAIVKFLQTGVNDADLPLQAKRHRRSGLIYDLRRKEFPKEKLDCFPHRWGTIQMAHFEEMQWTTLAPDFGKSNNENEVLHYDFDPRTILPFLDDGEYTTTGEQELFGGGGRVFKARIHPDHHPFHHSQVGTFSLLELSSMFFEGVKLQRILTSIQCFHSDVIRIDTRASGRMAPLPKSRKDCLCRFAIKHLHSTDKTLFLKEVEVLRKFSNERHPHLISLLATYEQAHNFSLIFPWADASLYGYWKSRNPCPKMDKDTVLWVAEQCLGIAKGVLAIHKYESFDLSPSKGDRYGHHGDIKPENILWFPENHESQAGPPQFQRGTLKLTDFGLAAINTTRTVSRNVEKLIVSRCYCAPELDFVDGGGAGRQTDMWAMGCLYLEFVTWLIGGWKLVSDFSGRRSAVDHHPMWALEDFKTDTFFTVIRNTSSSLKDVQAIIKPEVTEFIEELHAHPKCTEFIHDVLDMVEFGLLIVKQNGRQHPERPSSQRVCMKLNEMWKRCVASESYGCTPKRRDPARVKRTSTYDYLYQQQRKASRAQP